MIQNRYKILEQFIQIAYKKLKFPSATLNDTKLIQNTRAIHTKAYKIAEISLFFVNFWAKSMKNLRRVELANIKILRRVELAFLKNFQKSG